LPLAIATTRGVAENTNIHTSMTDSPSTRAGQRSSDWVRAIEVLPSFSEVRSFVSGDGPARVDAAYWFHAAERRVRASVVFGPRAEGLAGAVHGGAIAGVFDEGLGLLAWYLGTPVTTRELVVRYRQFVPLGSALVLEGGLAESDGWLVSGTAVLRSPEGPEYAGARLSFAELLPEQVRELEHRSALGRFG
jgi:acyl-coenzyme A thioesterase PaaI-like protein